VVNEKSLGGCWQRFTVDLVQRKGNEHPAPLPDEWSLCVVVFVLFALVCHLCEIPVHGGLGRVPERLSALQPCVDESVFRCVN